MVNLHTKHDFNDKAGAISVEWRDSKGSVASNYDENCVYLYSNSKGKSYMKTICSKKGSTKKDTGSLLRQLTSLRIGKNCKVTITRNTSIGTASADLSGGGTSKVVELTSVDTKGFGRMSFNDQVTEIKVKRK